MDIWSQLVVMLISASRIAPVEILSSLDGVFRAKIKQEYRQDLVAFVYDLRQGMIRHRDAYVQ